MSYRVLLHKHVVKYLQELDEEARSRVKEHVRELQNFPKSKPDLVKIAGEEDVFQGQNR